MIYCPNCGTSNRQGSRFCSECGESLPSTGTRCPMCGTINPVSNVYCEKCTARLVPMTSPPEEEKGEEEAEPIKGISLPTIPLDERDHDEETERTSDRESAGEDWLDALRESADEADRRAEEAEGDRQIEESAGAPEPADIPDWLHDMGPVSEEHRLRPGEAVFSPGEDSEEERSSEEEQPEKEVAESTDIPEQRRELDTPEAETPKTGPPSGPEDEAALEPAEVPDGVRDLRGVNEKAPASSDEATEVTEEPLEEDWRAGQPQAEGFQPEGPRLEEFPEWLQEAAPVAAEGELSLESGEAGSTGIEPPDWLEETPTTEAEFPPAEPRPEEEISADERSLEEEAEAEREPSRESIAFPSWLREAESGPEEELPEEPPTTSVEAPLETFEPPEWLSELMEAPRAEEEASPFAIEAMLADDELSGSPRRADIPDWLQDMRPQESEREEAPGGLLETEGLLKGLRGLIPASSGIKAPSAYEITSAVVTSEVSRARAELLQSLLGQPISKPRPDVAEEEPGVAGLVERWVVAVVLLVTVLGMLLAPLITGQGLQLTQPVAVSGATQLYETVNALDGSDNVLVAFDYGPPEADELNRVAEPVLEHLLDSGTGISIVSTRPDGPPVAAALMGGIADSSDQYTLLGYRPGAGTAVSQLLSAADERPALLLVLTSRPGPLQRWVEQAHARYGDELPVVAAGSALLEPVTSPYLDANAGQLRAAIHGLRGAAAYETLQGARTEAAQRLDVLAAGHIAIVVLMIAGAAVYGLGGAGGRKA